MKLLLALALLCSTLPGRAGDISDPAVGEPGAVVAAKQAHPDLLRLERDLTRELDEKKDGLITSKQYQAWKIDFRARLAAAMAHVPPSPDNTAVYARITAQLGEQEKARAALNQALEQNPESPVLLRTKGHILFEQNDFPGAAHNALQAWENSGRTDQGAWELYQMSKGRSAPSGTASASPSPSPRTRGPSVVSADDSNKPFKLAVKSSALPSTVPVPGLSETEPLKRGGGLPLWPLAVPIAGGLIAYGVYRGTKQTDAKETEQPAIGALITAPGLVTGSAEVADGVIRNVAKGAAVTTLGDIVVTGVVAAGILVAGGTAVILTVNHGLNEMIAAQDKYNEAIDARRNDKQPLAQRAHVFLPVSPGKPYSTLNEDELRQAEYERAKDFCNSPPQDTDNECSDLSKKIDHAEKCVKLYEAWDDRWEPRRHRGNRIAEWNNRIKKYKEEHKRKCAQE